jgi:hypothetical protein
MRKGRHSTGFQESGEMGVEIQASAERKFKVKGEAGEAL